MAVKENYKIVFDTFQSSEPVDVTSEFGVITTLSEGKDTKLNAYNTWNLDQVRVAETIKPLNEEEVEGGYDGSRNPLYEMRFTANQKIPTDIQYRIVEE